MNSGEMSGRYYAQVSFLIWDVTAEISVGKYCSKPKTWSDGTVCGVGTSCDYCINQPSKFKLHILVKLWASSSGSQL